VRAVLVRVVVAMMVIPSKGALRVARRLEDLDWDSPT